MNLKEAQQMFTSERLRTSCNPTNLGPQRQLFFSSSTNTTALQLPKLTKSYSNHRRRIRTCAKSCYLAVVSNSYSSGCAVRRFSFDQLNWAVIICAFAHNVVVNLTRTLRIKITDSYSGTAKVAQASSRQRYKSVTSCACAWFKLQLKC